MPNIRASFVSAEGCYGNQASGACPGGWQVKGKVNAITMDSCTRTGLVFEDMVAACELVNSANIQVQVTGVVPTIAIDKCDGVQVRCRWQCVCGCCWRS